MSFLSKCLGGLDILDYVFEVGWLVGWSVTCWLAGYAMDGWMLGFGFVGDRSTRGGRM